MASEKHLFELAPVGNWLNWLRVNVPGLAESVSKTSRKHLGWYLGIDSTDKSYQELLTKFAHRVREVVEGKAPSTICSCRCNQRVVPVLSHVSRFACPRAGSDIAGVDQLTLHNTVRTPPNSTSRRACHSMSSCSAVGPVP